jgi:EAL domain-containing protein (putative c-di-GMP-specific phosphodiesterase class I)
LRCVEHTLWRSDIRPDLLTLEITESTEMRDWDQARFIISRLRKMGCKIAIDDFGTGFSSLAYLRSMEADELKIDRSLLAEIEVSEKSRLMLASVFEIAQNLELDVTVEGIETDLEAEIIQKMGGLRAQGFLFGRPVPSMIALEATLPRSPAEPKDATG